MPENPCVAETPPESETHVGLSTESTVVVDVFARQTDARPSSSGTKSDVDLPKLQLLAMVARETSDAVIITNQHFDIVWTNAAACHITGYSGEEMYGQNLLVISKAFTLSPETAQRMVEDLPAGKRFATVAWTVRKNGDPLLADFEVIPYRDEQGSIAAFIGITQDVTARARAEQALRESEEHLRDAQDLAGFGSWRFFVDTNEIRWSEQLFRAFKRPLTKPPPTLKEYLAYLDPETEREFGRLVHAAIHDGTPYEITFQATREDGTKAHLHGRGNVRRDVTGRIVELYGTTQDITARVQAEQERIALQERLAASQRLESLGLLAGGVAHDFNNLVMGVMMDASLLEREVAPRSRLADAVANIQEASIRMAELTNQLLAYAGRGRFVLERINPHEVVAAMLELVKGNLHAEVSFEVEIAHTPATIEIDSSQLRQVVMNLVWNASDALGGHAGRIAVRTRIVSNGGLHRMWELEVSDSGSGMTEEVRRRIFEPFYTTKTSGRGLGLSSVHGIIQRSRGSIDVQSRPGHGTTFFVRLPLVDELPIAPPTKPAIRKAPRPLRVLIADDEAMVRRSLRRMLELHQAHVVEVADGMAAVEAMAHAETPFDIALVDIMMPRLNGYDVLSEARRRRIATGIVLMSGYNNLEHEERAQGCDYQPDAILQKPFAWEDLKRVLHDVARPEAP